MAGGRDSVPTTHPDAYLEASHPIGDEFAEGAAALDGGAALAQAPGPRVWWCGADSYNQLPINRNGDQ